MNKTYHCGGGILKDFAAPPTYSAVSALLDKVSSGRVERGGCQRIKPSIFAIDLPSWEELIVRLRIFCTGVDQNQINSRLLIDRLVSEHPQALGYATYFGKGGDNYQIRVSVREEREESFQQYGVGNIRSVVMLENSCSWFESVTTELQG
jgi:hypothetical protein